MITALIILVVVAGVVTWHITKDDHKNQTKEEKK